MKIVDLIKRDMVVPALKATDKRGILEELAASITRRKPIDDVHRNPLANAVNTLAAAFGEGAAG